MFAGNNSEGSILPVLKSINNSWQNDVFDVAVDGLVGVDSIGSDGCGEISDPQPWFSAYIQFTKHFTTLPHEMPDRSCIDVECTKHKCLNHMCHSW